MSQAMDALNRWHAKRDRLTRRPVASAMPAHAHSPHPPRGLAFPLRKGLLLSVIAVGLVGVGHPASSAPPSVEPPLVEATPVAPPQTASNVSSSPVAPFAGDADADADAAGPQEPLVRPRLPNVTPREAALARARDLVTQRRYARAVTVLSPLFVTPPRTWEPWFWLGTAQLGLGRWEEARTSLREGLARDAASPQLWVHQALVSQQQGRPGEALESLRQAELLAPQLPEVQLNLAYVLEMRGATPVAVEHYRMFLALTGDQHAYDGTREKVRAHLLQLVNR